MREKYESLSLTVLRDVAKNRGIKGTSSMRKEAVIEAMVAEDEKAQATEAIKAQAVESGKSTQDMEQLDSGQTIQGILEVMTDGFGFIRSDHYLPGENDVYVSPAQIRRFGLKTGDIVIGNTKVKTEKEKFCALLYVKSVNGLHPEANAKRPNFEDLTPIFPNERIRLERAGGSMAMRIMDEIAPIGKGQRGMIVSPPKAGKTTLLKDVAKSITKNNPEMYLIILLIDERPEEVTDVKEAIEGKNVEVVYSTFDELAERHKRISEMVIERAKRLVESGRDVAILLDSITRLARAYNLTVPPSGRTLSGGLDPAALHMPKRFFGAARNMREGGSLTILATALVDTGSKMDDVVYEEFKSTGNMELVLDRKVAEKRVFPAIDIPKSSTRREDLLLNTEEQQAMDNIRKALNGMKADDAVETILNLFARTKNNEEFAQNAKKTRFF
ncbi:MAG: transcription termination factor Rho [Lachnospiraceae bacterium]|jgi:transcription termination factor Rho|nr:transcription termination factor Rho [Lachnospiraceae bacterium]MDE7058567.1 transcription termination factor Rho [Lachnospiraceae bacterium]